MQFVTTSVGAAARIGRRAGLIASASIIVVLLVAASENQSPLVLRSVSQRALALSGITLAQPSDMTGVGANESKAIAAVLEFQPPGTDVREAVLATASVFSMSPPLTCSCWIVSVMPPSGVESSGASGTSPTPGDYSLWFVDATSGDVVFGVEGGEPH